MSYETRHFKAGDFIFRADQFGDFGCIVKSGKVAIRAEKNGSLLELGTLHAGQCFGEMAAISPGNRTADIIAKEDCEIIIVERDVVKDLLNQANPIAKIFIQSLVERIARMTLHAIDDKAANSPIMSVASILALRAKDSSVQSKKGAVTAKGLVKLPYRYTIQVIEDTIGLLPYRTDAVLTIMARHKIIILKYGADSYISINPKTVVAQTRELEENLGDELEKQIRSQFDLIDLDDFAKLMQISTEKALEKLGGNHYPDDLVLFRKSIAEEIASSPGEIISAASEKKPKTLDEIFSLDDLNWVPAVVLETVLKGFRAFELAGILSQLSEQMQDDILEVVSDSARDQVRAAMLSDKKQDADQVRENTESFLEKIRATPPPKEEESEEVSGNESGSEKNSD
jgi:CRP-like cAMP-binding protein